MNRHSRALLTIVIVAPWALPYWFFSRRLERADPRGADARSRPARGGALVATSRTDPPSFNRLAQPAIATELFAHADAGTAGPHQPRDAGARAVAGRRVETSADGRTYTLTLRDGVVWSDGTPFTSADVAVHVRGALRPRHRQPAGHRPSPWRSAADDRPPDARTVVVTYPGRFGPGIRLLDNLPMMPKHKLAGALAAGTFAKAWAADTPPSELVVDRAVRPHASTSRASGWSSSAIPRYWRKRRARRPAARTRTG